MFKIKKDPILKDVSSDYQFFNNALLQNEVENLYEDKNCRKSLDPISNEFQICQTNVTGNEEPFQISSEPNAVDSTSVFAGE
jgi:hypothetical protein